MKMTSYQKKGVGRSEAGSERLWHVCGTLDTQRADTGFQSHRICIRQSSHRGVMHQDQSNCLSNQISFVILPQHLCFYLTFLCFQSNAITQVCHSISAAHNHFRRASNQTDHLELSSMGRCPAFWLSQEAILLTKTGKCMLFCANTSVYYEGKNKIFVFAEKFT